MTDEPKKLSMEEWLKKRKAEQLKKLQEQWRREDESGETEAAIERWKFRTRRSRGLPLRDEE